MKESEEKRDFLHHIFDKFNLTKADLDTNTQSSKDFDPNATFHDVMLYLKKSQNDTEIHKRSHS